MAGYPQLTIRIAVIISINHSNRGFALRLPSRPFEGLFELLSADASLSDNRTVGQHDRDAPVVEAEQLVVGVDIREMGVEAELAE